MAEGGGAVNLAAAVARLDAPYRPAIVGHYNDNKLAVVKVHGEFAWHSHRDTDAASWSSTAG